MAISQEALTKGLLNFYIVTTYYDINVGFNFFFYIAPNNLQNLAPHMILHISIVNEYQM